MKKEDWIILGAVVIGGYLLYKLFKPAADLAGVAGGAIDTVGGAIEALQQPISTETTQSGVGTPPLATFFFPPAAIPTFVDTFMKDSQGNINLMAAPIKAAADLGVGLGFIDIKKPTTAAYISGSNKKSVQVNVNAPAPKAYYSLTAGTAKYVYPVSKGVIGRKVSMHSIDPFRPLLGTTTSTGFKRKSR